MSFFLLALISAVVMQLVGWAWHMPLFGKHWMRALGVDPVLNHDMTGYMPMGLSLVVNFAMNYLMALVLFLLLNVLGAPNFAGAAMVSGIVMLGFVVPILINDALWGGRKARAAWTMFGISLGYQIVHFIFMAGLFVWLA